ncbi:hypothetical protein FKW77_003430 [Venturia effusa]|uniref:Cyclochlorotine biosynthesis protein O n=1 Tax=Venturia effusa TaxID=50376 RepID=A0A517L716_9PEZI|nr:hypothetical protein FKW77_003430 [Venturia effusa]
MFAATYFRPISTLEHVRHFSTYSSAERAIEYETVKFNLTMSRSSPYTGKGPEVDRAWNALSYDGNVPNQSPLFYHLLPVTVGDQMITPEELGKIDMPISSLKVKHPKTGVEGYRVGLEVFHQLHCINLLRQVTYRDHYSKIGSGMLAAGEKELQNHTGKYINLLTMRKLADVTTDHCLEVLRMNIQCTVDVGLFTFYMLPGDPLPWPELNSWHTCRNFDAVRDWALEHSVGNMERPGAMDPSGE